ncbi:MAG TPA: Spy/CpxP family protein refolding chaperone [Parasulfuritortus sp.]
MRKTRYLSTLAACVLALGVAGAGLVAYAADNGSADQSANSGWGYGMGPGMMGGYGGGYGYGMGPGMMGGYGGGYGMGPGMMGGYGGGWGMGPGMMGGYGGMGMMGAYLGSELNLTDAQQAKINKIMDETRKQHWALMGAMMDQQVRLRDLSAAPKQDDAAIGAAYKSLSQLQQQMFETMVGAQKRMDAVLTKEQREQLRNYWHRGWGTRR